MRKTEQRMSMRDRIRNKANRPRTSKFDYIEIPNGFEKFVVQGKVKETGDKRILTKRIDIMPYNAGKNNPNCDEGELYFERTFHIHSVKVSDDNTVKFVCPKKNAGLPCPACEMAAKLRKDPKATKEEIRNWETKERQLFNVRDLAEPDTPKIWDISYHLFGKTLDARISGQDDDDNFDSFAELKGGKTLRVQFEEKKYNGIAFFETQSIDFKDREEDYEDGVVEESACLDDLLIIRPYDELSKQLFETDDVSNIIDEVESEETAEEPLRKPAVKKETKPIEKAKDGLKYDDDDEDDEEEEPVKKQPAKPAKKQVIEDDEDEDEGEDDEEVPVKKSSKKPVDDDEDEDEEEEEEEKPSKKPVEKVKPKKGKCPYGHKWGIDCDEDDAADDCAICDLWDECSDAQEEMNE